MQTRGAINVSSDKLSGREPCPYGAYIPASMLAIIKKKKRKKKTVELKREIATADLAQIS